MCWLCFGIGILLGAIISSFVMMLRSSRGTFLIDNSDPEKDVYKLNLGDLDEVSKKRLIVVRIEHAKIDGDSQN